MYAIEFAIHPEPNIFKINKLTKSGKKYNATATHTDRQEKQSNGLNRWYALNFNAYFIADGILAICIK